MFYSIDRLQELYKGIMKAARQYLPAQSDDLTQEIIVNLWTKRLRLPARFGSGYLHSLVRNAAYDMIRKEQKHKKFCYSPMNENESMSFVGEPTPRLYLLKGGLYEENDNALEECLAAIDSYARTMAAVEKLPPEQRSVIELYANGWTYAEIAELQGLPAGTVRSRLHYARKKLEVLRNESN